MWTLFMFPDRLVRTRMIRRTYTRYVSHIFYVSYHSSSSPCIDTTECYCFLRLLAAIVRLHRTGTRACSRCVVVPDMVTAYFVPVFFSFSSGIFLPNQPESTLEFHETSIKAAAAWQRRDSIGGWLHHLRRSLAVRSDAWVMVMLLHLDCIQRNKWSRRTIRRFWRFTSCTTLSGIIRTYSVFMSTPKRL